MKPAVVIATDKRIAMTKANIESLRDQSLVPDIVLVVSDDREQMIYQQQYPFLHVVRFPNNPLGQKWQRGVNKAREIGADPVIICGSDDILGKDFVWNVTNLVDQGYHFVGLFQWFVWNKGYLYKFDYNAKIPLGGGRAYSKELLNALNWRIFDVGKNKHLDDAGYHSAVRSGFLNLLVEDCESFGLNIVAVKGSWPVMNEFATMLHHPNCTLLQKERGSEKVTKLIGFKPLI